MPLWKRVAIVVVIGFLCINSPTLVASALKASWTVLIQLGHSFQVIGNNLGHH